MSIIDKQLKGNNLCNMSCVEQDQVIHPETCSENVLMACENQSNTNLKDWILSAQSVQEPQLYGSLLEWLQHFYNGTVAYTLQPATSSTLGGIKVGQYLSIDNGVLSVNKLSLEIPDEYILEAADHIDDKFILGGVNIYNTLDGKMRVEVEEGVSILNGGTIDTNFYTSVYDSSLPPYNPENPDDKYFYLAPVDIIKTPASAPEGEACINENNIVVAIPKNLFTYEDIRNRPSIPDAQIQSDWNQSNADLKDYIKNKPTIPNNTNQLTNGAGYITINDLPLSNDRTIEGPDGSSWASLSDSMNITYTGNPVVNLDTDNAKMALTTLLSKPSVADTVYNITLYIPAVELDISSIADPLKLTCYSDSNTFEYTDDGNGNFTFTFVSAISRVDYFQNGEECILYVKEYSLISPTI